jgi:hypothetical protein
MFTSVIFEERNGWRSEEDGGKTLHLRGLVPELVEQ